MASSQPAKAKQNYKPADPECLRRMRKQRSSGPTGLMVQPLRTEFLDLALQVGPSQFEHGAVTGFVAPLKLLHDAL